MKELRYSIQSDLYEIASKPIRNRYDLLRLLALTLKSITIQEDTKEIVDTNHEGKNGVIVIYTERMSRIFYYLEGKHFSFHFPFYIEMNGELQKSCIYKGDTLVNDALITSMMVSIICNEEFVNISFSDLRDYIGEIIKTDYAGSEISVRSLVELVECLLSFEAGYIRYDEDMSFQDDDKKHPRYHLDVNYDSSATYKIGLSAPLKKEDLVDITNTNTNCSFLIL